MNNEVKEAVVKVLRESFNGFSNEVCHYSSNSSLSLWKKWFNKLSFFLGAEQAPFIDELNYQKIICKPLCAVVYTPLINKALEELSAKPVCSVCGSDELEPDPAGYYHHAKDSRGAPLMCSKEHE